MVVKFVRLSHGAGLPVPAYQTAGAAGLDLCSAQEVSIPVGGYRRVSTGFRVKIPAGYVGDVRTRSSMAHKYQTVVLNSPGTIDSDYTGELFIMLFNLSNSRVEIKRGDRVAQLVVLPYLQAAVQEVEDLPPTSRGAGAFGSTGGVPGSPLHGSVMTCAGCGAPLDQDGLYTFPSGKLGCSGCSKIHWDALEGSKARRMGKSFTEALPADAAPGVLSPEVLDAWMSTPMEQRHAAIRRAYEANGLPTDGLERMFEGDEAYERHLVRYGRPSQYPSSPALSPTPKGS